MKRKRKIDPHLGRLDTTSARYDDRIFTHEPSRIFHKTPPQIKGGAGLELQLRRAVSYTDICKFPIVVT